MLLVGIFSWWYSEGLAGCINGVRRRLAVLSDVFSIELMFRTLFLPFRQISAHTTGISAGAKLSAFFDRLVSRLVGAFARTFMIITGVVVMLLYLIIGTGSVILWLILPLMPIVGVIGYLLS